MQKAEGSRQKTACLSSCLPPSAYCLLVFAYCLLVVLCSFFVLRAVIEAIKVHYLVASRSIASDSIKAIFRPAAVEDFDTFNVGLENFCVNAERVAGKNKKICVFAGFE